MAVSRIDAQVDSTKIDDIKICLSCQGSGTLRQTEPTTHIVRDVTCSRCQGEGVLGSKSSTKIENSDTMSLKIAGDRSARRGEYELAVEKYTAAIENAEPNLMGALANRALAYFQLAQYSKAEADASRVIEDGGLSQTDPMYIRALLRRGITKARLGHEGAFADLDKVLKIQPGHPMAIEESAKLRNTLPVRPPIPPSVSSFKSSDEKDKSLLKNFSKVKETSSIAENRNAAVSQLPQAPDFSTTKNDKEIVEANKSLLENSVVEPSLAIALPPPAPLIVELSSTQNDMASPE